VPPVLPDKIGVYENGACYLDYNGSGVWDAGIDKAYGVGGGGIYTSN